MSKLIIVESPAKARTISAFLGKEFVVKASMGHVRDLPKSQLGIDVEKDFAPQYIISKEKTKVVKELQDAVKKAELLILATDEDREGEAISWHLLRAFGLEVPDSKSQTPNKSETPNSKSAPRKTKSAIRNPQSAIQIQRIAFHEITKSAIQTALENPRELDMQLVDAQQARRVLDRIVGYELSPLLWKKIRYGLSAGRVQSVAVRLVVEREREIEAFRPEEYWSLTARLETPRGDHFHAELAKIGGKKAGLTNKGSTEKVVADLRGAEWRVANLEKKETRRNPAPPFTTSTLQQEASRKLGFGVKKTMMLAQKLYEGADTGEGLITYMRTDSVNLAVSAIARAREVIAERFGKEYVPEKSRAFKTKSKGAQEAHEAIRPTDPARTPESLTGVLEKDTHRLYELIWKRTLACQMAEAVLDQTGVDIDAKEYAFRATGQIVKFPGFLKVYTEGRDSEEEEAADAEKRLPEILANEVLKLDELLPEQHFTKPPARYTEASLVKKLEAEGIGRPSTYAPTIATIEERGYIVKEAKALKPTDTGCVVNDFLVEHFAKIMDYKFTAGMENTLDEIAEGKRNWVEVLREFYEPFHKTVGEKTETVKKGDAVKETTDEICEKCGKPMMVKLGRFGKFLSCSNYPTCKNARPMKGDAVAEQIQTQTKELEGRTCPECQKPLEVKRSRFGAFIGCSGYPECKYTEKIEKKTGVKCPDCGNGELIERIAKKMKKKFWGCNRFPKCKYASWEFPAGRCESCNGLIVLRKNQKICAGCGKTFPTEPTQN